MKHYDDTLYAEYFRLTDKYTEEYGEKTILLYQNGTFLEMYAYYDKETGQFYGSKMQEITQCADLKMSEKYKFINEETYKEQVIYMSGFTLEYSFDKYVKIIQNIGYTSVIYLQQENKANTTRVLYSIISPGTFLNPNMESSSSSSSTSLSNHVSCVWIHKNINTFYSRTSTIQFGIANVNIYTGESSIYQYKESIPLSGSLKDQTIYDELANFLYINNPNELIFIYNTSEQEMDTLIAYVGCQGTLLHKVNIGLNDNKSMNIKRANNCQKQIYQEEVLKRFYENANKMDFLNSFYQNELSTQAFVYLLEFIYNHNPNLVKKINEPIFENRSSHLILANHSLKQLNIIDDNEQGQGQGQSKKMSCVLTMLNNCITPMGKRKFAYNLLHPIYPQTQKEFFVLQREYDIIEYLSTYNTNTEKENINEKNKEKRSVQYFMDLCSKILPEMKDLAKYERQIMDKKISPYHLVCLYQNCKQISQFFSLCKNDVILQTYFLEKMNIPSIDFIEQHTNNICEFIDKRIHTSIAVNMDIRMNIGKNINDFEVNFFRPNISTHLDHITTIYNTTTNKLESIRLFLCDLLKNESKRAISADPVILHKTEKGDIYTLITTNRRCEILETFFPKTEQTKILSYPIGMDFEKKIDSEIEKEKTDIFHFVIGKKVFQYIKQGASSDKYGITNAPLNELYMNKTTSKSEMKTVLSEVYMQVLEEFSLLQSSIEYIIQFITSTDMIYSKTVLARKYGYCKPQFGVAIENMDVSKTKSFIQCKAIRHPLIEQIQTDTIYVPNDLQIGYSDKVKIKDITTDSNNKEYSGILLYGTNMVGKTSFIKSLGIAVIMAQAGLYVPATEFVYMPYQYIFTRILGNDNLFKGQSTFATEMIELRTILRLANANSLVIGDELCSGTETASAVGIFMAGIKQLYELNCSFLFATHLHEIVGFEELSLMSRIRICHMKVRYNRETGELEYERKLTEGSGETMYGLEVCQYLKLPTPFMEMAYCYRKKFIDIPYCSQKEPDILLLKPSHYNSKKLKGGVCESCEKKISTEIHHIVEQHTANEDGLVYSKKEKVPIHKNKKANLRALCESCHLKEHYNMSL